MKFLSRSFLIFFIAVTALHFSTKLIVAEDATQPKHGESGLSKRPWQYGVFVQSGFAPNYKNDGGFLHWTEQLQLFSAGVEIGKQTHRVEGPRLLRGRGEALLEVMPYWLARFPKQNLTYYLPDNAVVDSGIWNGEDFHGASVTPFLLRWNFSQRDSARVVPWTQFGGGLLWTNHKFPLSYYGGTSVINFTPQVGAGVNVFNKPKHSVNLAMKMIHISNASLGDNNPAIHVTLQFSAGYSWWR